MKGTIINIEQELEQLQNDERLINRYLLEKYPQISNYRLRSIERFFKIGAILVQSLILLVQMENNFCQNDSSDSVSRQNSNKSNDISSILDCSLQKTKNLSIISSILLMIIGFWLILTKYMKKKFFHKIGVQAAFLVLVILTQIITLEIYIFKIVSYFWSFLLSIHLVLLIDQYIKQLKLGFFGQVFTVVYFLLRFYIQYSINYSQFIIGGLLFTLLILQTFSNKVLYRNKIQILQMTRNQLNSVRQFYNDLLSLIPQGLTLLDSNQNIIYANSRVTEILQCKEEDIFSILMNLSNNNAQKQSTFLDQEFQTRQTRQISASINVGQADQNQQNAQVNDNSQNSNSIKIHTQASKQFNSYQIDENHQLNSQVFNTPISALSLQQKRNKLFGNMEEQNSVQFSKKYLTQLSQKNYKMKDQMSIQEDQSNTGSYKCIIQQASSIIQQDSQHSDRDLKETEDEPKYNASKYPNQKQTQYAQSKFGTQHQRNQQQSQQSEMLDDHQYTLGAEEMSQANKEMTFGKDSSKYNNLEQSTNLKEQMYAKNFSLENQYSINSSKSGKRFKKSISQNSQYENLKTEERSNTDQIQLKENISKQTTSSQVQASVFNTNYQPDSFPRDEYSQSSQIFDKTEQHEMSNCSHIQGIGDKSMQFDISTLPFQTTDRKSLFFNIEENNELESQFFKEHMVNEDKNYSSKLPSDQENRQKTEVSLSQNNYKSQNTYEAQRQETSLKLQQHNYIKEIPKEFSFISTQQVNIPTNSQINSPKVVPNSNNALGPYNSAAFPSIFNVEEAKNQETENSLTRDQKAVHQPNENYFNFNQDILSFKSLDLRQDIEFLKKQKQNFFLQENDIIQQLSNNNTQQLTEQELAVLHQQNLLLQKEFSKRNKLENDDLQDDCFTECRKQIQERSINKRQSRLEKLVKTLEVQDLPKYNEDKQNPSYFKQAEKNLSNSQSQKQENGSQSTKTQKENSKKDKSQNKGKQLSPQLKPSKEKNFNNQSLSKAYTSHNIVSNQKPLDSLVSQINRGKGENNNMSQYNPIEGENMTLKKYVISQKESNDSAYKSIFQPKIIKKETKVKNILSKLLTLNKPDQREPDTQSEMSQRTKQISLMEQQQYQENVTKNQISNNYLKIQEPEEQDIVSCMTSMKQDQIVSLDTPQLPRSKTEYNFKYKNDVQSNTSNIDQLTATKNNSNNLILADSDQNRQDQKFNILEIAKASKNSSYKKAKSPTIGGNMSFSKSFLPSLKPKNQNQNDLRQSFNRNKGRKESFFNQFNKEANIGYYQFKDDIAHLQVE
ncbi:hypothetical protein ABPG74_015843 [Tetrahymena malaccensis]